MLPRPHSRIMNGGSPDPCPPGGDDPASWVFRGMFCMRRRDYDRALAAFERALTLDPSLIEAILGMGNVHYALERYDEALRAYDRALAVAPDRPALHIARSNALDALGRCEEARGAFDRAIALRCRSHQ